MQVSTSLSASKKYVKKSWVSQCCVKLQRVVCLDGPEMVAQLSAKPSNAAPNLSSHESLAHLRAKSAIATLGMGLIIC